MGGDQKGEILFKKPGFPTSHWECLETLEKADRVWFEIRNAKIKVFSSAKSDNNLDPVYVTNKLLKEMIIDSLMEIHDSPKQ